jgi:hypothetical protein
MALFLEAVAVASQGDGKAIEKMASTLRDML